MTFIILGRLESLNQTLKIPRYRFFQSRRRQAVKRMLCGWVMGQSVPAFCEPVRIHIHWVEKDHRRDFDNIRAGAKLILDALVVMARIQNDSQKWVVALTDSYAVDKARPRIEVTIVPATERIPDMLRAPAAPEGSKP